MALSPGSLILSTILCSLKSPTRSCRTRIMVLCFTCRLVLRIRADDPNAVCQLGIKFGCSLSDGRELLNMARKLDLNVVGIR